MFRSRTVQRLRGGRMNKEFIFKTWLSTNSLQVQATKQTNGCSTAMWLIMKRHTGQMKADLQNIVQSKHVLWENSRKTWSQRNSPQNPQWFQCPTTRFFFRNTFRNKTYIYSKPDHYQNFTPDILGTVDHHTDITYWQTMGSYNAYKALIITVITSEAAVKPSRDPSLPASEAS